MKQSLVRLAIGVLEALIALSAVAGGILMLAEFRGRHLQARPISHA